MELRIPEPFLQKHLEAFQVALSKAQSPDDSLVESIYRGYMIKAAIEAGWMDDCDVGEMLASDVVDVSHQIQEKIVEITQVSKN